MLTQDVLDQHVELHGNHGGQHMLTQDVPGQYEGLHGDFSKVKGEISNEEIDDDVQIMFEDLLRTSSRILELRSREKKEEDEARKEDLKKNNKVK